MSVESAHSDEHAPDDDLTLFMLGVLMRQDYEERHDRRSDYLLALDWVVDAWLPEGDPKRRDLTNWAQACSRALDDMEVEHGT